jgi:cytochrome P450
MTSLFYYLSRYLKCYDKLAQEIRSTFQSGKDIKAGATLATCKYLRACIDETLRISPPQGGTLWRQVPRDGAGRFLIDGTPIPEGTNIGVNTYSMHHNEPYFPEPWTFRPERFLGDEDCVRNDVKAAFVPFSFGPRGCAGKSSTCSGAVGVC